MSTVAKATLALTLVTALASDCIAATSVKVPRWIVEQHATLDYLGERGTSVSWRLRRSDGTGAPVTLILTVMPRKEFAVTVENVDRQGATSSIYSRQLCPGAIAVMNGGFYVDGPVGKAPLGLLIAGGKFLSKASSRRTGGFLVIGKNGVVSVLPRRSASFPSAYASAVESTPILIRDGADDMKGDSKDRFDRVAAGTTTEGSLIFAGAFAHNQQTLSLAEFSQLILASSASAGIKVDDLIAMDGGPSAHIWYPRSAVLYGARGPTYLPSAICVRPRR